MAISSPGLGSGLDVNSIVTQLMAVERQPLTVLQQKQASFTAKISALGNLKGALSSLQSASAALKTASTFTAFKASVADSTVASATVGTGVAAGTYTLDVTQLAQAQVLNSAASPTLVDGKLIIQVGSGAAVDVAVNATDSLTDVAARINADTTLATQLSASVVDNKLVLMGTSTGTANAITVNGQANDLGTGLDAFDTVNLNVTRPALDAQFKLNGLSITRSSNTVTDALAGVTLTLSKVTTSPTTLSVGRDVSTVQGALTALVNSYNDVNKTISSLGAYDAAAKQGSILTGNATLRSAQSQVRGVLNSVPDGLSGTAVTNLTQVGISVQRDGSLVMDATKLKAAFDSDPVAVANAVAAYGTAMESATNSMTSTGGLVTASIDGFNNSVIDIDKRATSLNVRLVETEKRYRAQFSALDVLMSNLSQTSAALTQQLASLPKLS